MTSNTAHTTSTTGAGTVTAVAPRWAPAGAAGPRFIRSASSSVRATSRCSARPTTSSSRSSARRTPPTVIVGGGPADHYQRVHRPQPERRRSAGRSQPNYVARRIMAALVAVLVVMSGAAAITGLAASFGGAPASAADVSPSGHANAPTRHVAQPGDTLWSIASTYRGSVAHDRYLEALIRLNGGTAIEVGQAVRLP